MADGPRFEAPLRRREEQRTDYKKRLQLLKSGEHRAVIRLSNNHAQVQVVAYHPDGDDTVTAAVSKHLQEHGWDHHTGNIPAAYLTGYLAGKRALDAGVETVVPDLGVYRPEYGGREYAVIAGLRDAGMDLKVADEVLPDETRLHGEHADAHESEGIADAVDAVKDAIETEYGG